MQPPRFASREPGRPAVGPPDAEPTVAGTDPPAVGPEPPVAGTDPPTIGPGARLAGPEPPSAVAGPTEPEES